MPKYSATINTPGYLPWDDDPPAFDDVTEAWDYLLGRRRDHEDDNAEEGTGYSATFNTLEHLAAGNYSDPWYGVNEDGTGSVSGPTPGYDGEHDLGEVYTVSEIPAEDVPVCGDDPCEHTPQHVTLGEDRAANPADYEDADREHAEIQRADARQGR